MLVELFGGIYNIVSLSLFFLGLNTIFFSLSNLNADLNKQKDESDKKLEDNKNKLTIEGLDNVRTKINNDVKYYRKIVAKMGKRFFISIVLIVLFIFCLMIFSYWNLLQNIFIESFLFLTIVISFYFFLLNIYEFRLLYHYDFCEVIENYINKEEILKKFEKYDISDIPKELKRHDGISTFNIKDCYELFLKTKK